MIHSSPTVVDGAVYVGSGDMHVYALTASDGSEQWRFKTDGMVMSSPAAVDETIYIGSNDGRLYVLS